LTTDTSALTSIANDSSFDYVFSRQIEALGTKGDIAIGLSTSGNSPNIIEAIKTAKKRGLLTAAFTGEGGGNLASLPDFLIDVPSEETPRIQEIHLILLHLLAQKIEEDLS
jgi:Phosphoheptose isomerase